MYGLIGRHLGHSASPALFADKVGVESYRLYPMDTLAEVLAFLSDPTLRGALRGALRGLNITFPYKVAIMLHFKYIDSLLHNIRSCMG